MSSLRIALVAPDCNRHDGQATYVLELGHYLARAGHRVDVWSVGFEAPPAESLRHVAVRAPGRAARLRFFVFLLRASRHLRRERYDLVHGLGASCLRPDVVTAQFCQAAWDEVAARRPELQGSPLDALLRRLIASVERRVLAAPTLRACIAVGPQLGDDLQRLYAVQAPIAIIPNGTDPGRFHPGLRDRTAATRRDIGLPTNAPVALFVGEFERKNLRTLLAALPHMKRHDLHVLAVGRSPVGPYRELAKTLGVAPRVHFAPHSGAPEQLFAAADLFVFPTLYEPFGMVVLEASACGTPVLTTASAGAAHWVERAWCGRLLADPLDAPALARELDDMLSSPGLLSEMAARGVELGRELTWSGVGRSTEALYAEVLGSARPPRDHTNRSPRSA